MRMRLHFELFDVCGFYFLKAFIDLSFDPITYINAIVWNCNFCPLADLCLV